MARPSQLICVLAGRQAEHPDMHVRHALGIRAAVEGLATYSRPKRRRDRTRWYGHLDHLLSSVGHLTTVRTRVRGRRWTRLSAGGIATERSLPLCPRDYGVILGQYHWASCDGSGRHLGQVSVVILTPANKELKQTRSALNTVAQPSQLNAVFGRHQ